MKVISVHKDDVFQIRLFGRCLLEYVDHYLISFSDADMGQLSQSIFDLVCENATADNVNDCAKAPFSLNRMKKYLSEQGDKTRGYIFYREEDHVPVGCLWVMFKGGNEFQYRIRHIDAFGFDFSVFDEFRGKGLIGHMIKYVLEDLKKDNIEKLYAGVRKNNEPALKAYSKVGAKIETEKKFYRIAGVRIPYPIL